MLEGWVLYSQSLSYLGVDLVAKQFFEVGLVEVAVVGLAVPSAKLLAKLCESFGFARFNLEHIQRHLNICWSGQVLKGKQL